MKKFIFGLCLLAALCSGCTDAQIAQISALSMPHTVTVYGWDGRIIKQYQSTGKVATESGSDGWYFEDASTRVLTRVSGGALIEVTPITQGMAK